DTEVLAFYDVRDFTPAWAGSDDAEANAATARKALERAYEQGLRSTDYTLPLKRWRGPPTEAHELALYDVTLTVALLRYAADVRAGRLGVRQTYKDVRLPAHTFDAAAELARALDRNTLDAFLSGLPPPQAGYRELANALAHYRAIEAE